ncbi:MAG TPA: tRNA (adenosine(37)-N6)-threonylcarbamoyltransferase complex transferase subunit TsaD [Candidatus Saccharimonadales bacterium]|nr:tRNA (adenosine(37)-N6)-threonylcarbamoyltransferase complex transferase subunit TsaD [Candidatus Saccharimonadales bacterium]
MIILGIETSCDETSAALIKGDKKESFVSVLSNVSATSLDLHAKTGGIIPEIAAREQIKYIIPVIKHALKEANKKPEDIDAIAITYGPGLIGSLLVGVETAKTLAFAWNKPVIPVNHLFGHVYANWILQTRRSSLDAMTFPLIALIVSGGHTDLILMKSHKETVWLGGTRDDAAGEAIDKIGREINFPYPSGPAFEQAAAQGNPKTYRFPRPIMYDKQYDFSFSGLKAAAIREINKAYPLQGAGTDEGVRLLDRGKADRPGWVTAQKGKLDPQTINDLARGVQDAIIDVLVYKTLRAAEEFAAKAVLLSGGVSANQTLREVFIKRIADKNLAIPFYAPEKIYCTDNAAMIATAGLYMGKRTSWQEIVANPELYFD